MSRLNFLRHLTGDYSRRVAPATHRPHPEQWADDRVTAAWLGHATVLLNFFGVWILTDPVFFSRIGLRLGPLIVGPKRYIACALRPSELPRIDLTLLSHAHMDHLDIRSLRHVPGGGEALAAMHTSDLVPRRRFRKVSEMGWNTERRIETDHGAVIVAAFRLKHWGARMQWDTQRQFNAYILERNGVRICFTGDTARIDAKELGSRGPINLLIAPIGAYHPWIANHCTPEEAVAMADEAGARYVMPVHHQTFKLSWEPMEEPIQRFEAALQGKPERIALREIGETFTLPRG